MACGPGKGLGVAQAGAGAALMVLAVPPVDAWPIGLLVWAPLAAVCAAGRVERAVWVGWLSGALAQTGVLASVPSALQRAGGASTFVAYASALALVVFEGGRFGVLAFLAARATRNGWPLAVSFPVALVTAEFIYPLLFPWTTCLFFQSAPVFLQAADLGGPLLLSAWAGLVNAALASAWIDRARRSASRWLALATATLAFVATYGIFRMKSIDRSLAGSPTIRVGVVQGNVERGSVDPSEVVERYRGTSLDLLRRERVDLLIWPETAIPYAMSSASVSGFLSDRVFHASPGSPAIDVPLLVGMIVEREPPPTAVRVRVYDASGQWQPEPPKRYNAAILATPDGVVRGEYDKRDLLAFGETIPGESSVPWLRRLLPRAGTFSPGEPTPSMAIAGTHVSATICFEDILSEPVRRSVEASDPDWLVNLTSDVWFGSSRVPALHLALAKLRAVEHRRFLVHATNTGVSAVVDPAGRIVADLPAHRTGSASVIVRPRRGLTPFAVVGNAPAWAVVIAAAFLCVQRRRFKAESGPRCALRHRKATKPRPHPEPERALDSLRSDPGT